MNDHCTLCVFETRNRDIANQALSYHEQEPLLDTPPYEDEMADLVVEIA